MSDRTSELATGLDEVTMLVERGSLDAAQTQAQALLLRHPNSAAVHAALGDVAAARHLHREAIEWYELSLRLEQAPQVRERLARERDRLDQERLEEFEETLPEPRNKRLLIAGIAGGAILLIVVLGLVALLSRPRPQEASEPAGAPSRPVERVAGGTPAAPGATTPPSRPGTRAGSSQLGTTARQLPAVSRSTQNVTVNRTESIDAPMADQDVLLTRTLSSLTWPSGETLGWRAQALVDPFTGYAMITVELPREMRSGDIYSPSMDMAYKLAVAAINADQGVETLTVRILTPLVDDKGRTMTLVAFRGNTSRERLDYYLKRGVQPDRQTVWSHVFATTWWNPSVPTGLEPAAS